LCLSGSPPLCVVAHSYNCVVVLWRINFLPFSPHHHSTLFILSHHVQPHHSTRSSNVVTLSLPPSSSSLKVNDRSFRHASPCLWNQLPKELRLPADHEDLSLLSDLSHVMSFITTVAIHSLLLLSSTPRSKLVFSTNPFLHSSSTFAPTGLTPWTL